MNRRHTSPPRDTPRRTEPVLGNLDQIDADEDRRATSRQGPAVPPRQDSAAPPRQGPPRRDPIVPPRQGPPPRQEPAAPPRPPPPFATGVRRERAPPRRRRLPWLAVVIVPVLIAVGAWVWTHQGSLRELLPQTQLNATLTRADTALMSGKLAGGPDSARDLYEAARALDPDNERALNGLQQVGNAELARARDAVQRKDYSQARASLEEARSLLGGGADVQAVDQALAKAVLHNSNVGVLINQARAALANGRIDGSDGAAALFTKVLAGDPHNPVARHGMDQVGDLLAARVRTRLDKHDDAGAKQTLSELSSLLPRYSQLPTLRASIASADRAADAQRDQYLAQGAADLRAGKVIGSGDDNAEGQFKAALAADPGNAKAQAGLGQVAEALIVQANAAIDVGHSGDARGLLDQAAALAPKSADLAAARSRLTSGGAEHADEDAESAPEPVAPLTPAQSAKVAQLVARGKAAARKGNIMLPPGDCAYDLYRAALGIDGNNPEAQAGLRALPQVTRSQFANALHDGDLEHARDMLATLQQLDPGDPAAASMRQQLGSAWLDRADHDATLGRMAAARTALAEAQQLVPQDPRISEVGARIHRND